MNVAVSAATLARAASHMPASAEDMLRTGLLNQWYLVCRSSEVGTKPIRLKRLNRDIALWRDASGKAHAVEDFCPHRGARLSAGHVVEGGLACAYHGLTVDGDGVVLAVPPVHTCPLVGQKAIASYPVREACGAVFLYFSNGAGGEVPEMQLPEELTSPEWSGFLHAAEWDCNWMLPLENRLDPMHAPFLHAQSFTLAFGVRQSLIQLHETPSGFVVERDNQRGVNIDRTEVRYKPGSNYWIATEIPYPKCVGGNFFRIVSHVTPIDEHRTYFWVFRWQKSSGWRRDLWHFLYRNRLDQRHLDVLEQDRSIMAGIPADVRERETLIQSDVGIARIRRMMKQEAESQIRQMQGAAK
jgi:phenylpropionate dioxygenase-like ring-hydroxylating dioxygenase large terminal subunit